MSTELYVLTLTAISIGTVHTILGPDHYVPFIAMSKARGWSLRKTLTITLLCGLGHVGSSILLGVIGLSLGTVVLSLEYLKDFESQRGVLASWLLIGFGLAYFCWGLVRAIRNKPHTHVHAHADGVIHSHTHVHQTNHLHVHETANASTAPDQSSSTCGDAPSQQSSMTPWILFVIFLFGPCEPLIPLLMYPAAEMSPWAVVWIATVFSVATLLVMSTAVVLVHLGATRFRLEPLHRYSHALAGFAVLVCGVLIVFGF